MAEKTKKKAPPRDDGFKPATLKIRIESPEEAEHFLQGLIVARSNNSSEFFVELIDGITVIMSDYRRIKLEKELEARREAGMA